MVGIRGRWASSEAGSVAGESATLVRRLVWGAGLALPRVHLRSPVIGRGSTAGWLRPHIASCGGGTAAGLAQARRRALLLMLPLPLPAEHVVSDLALDGGLGTDAMCSKEQIRMCGGGLQRRPHRRVYSSHGARSLEHMNVLAGLKRRSLATDRSNVGATTKAPATRAAGSRRP
ncbi:hypothetical protein T492DRAFT_1061588 [Pavlovales sp. CCMP2436]|nr:hypothetical protein T492DRAFT_1061588 [Pavlovales sp. CCMP2436]